MSSPSRARGYSTIPVNPLTREDTALHSGLRHSTWQVCSPTLLVAHNSRVNAQQSVSVVACNTIGHVPLRPNWTSLLRLSARGNHPEPISGRHTISGALNNGMDLTLTCTRASRYHGSVSKRILCQLYINAVAWVLRDLRPSVWPEGDRRAVFQLDRGQQVAGLKTGDVMGKGQR